MSPQPREYKNDPHRDAIEHEARVLQLELWNLHGHPWDRSVPPYPFEVLEPGVALRWKGYDVQTADSLGETLLFGKRMMVAGVLDRNCKTVRVSRRFPIQEQIFTAAHELGHVVLDHYGSSIHRDRPADLSEWRKDAQEQDADWFAACFLMPQKWVRRWFKNLFFTEQFVLTHDTAFALCGKSADAVLSRYRTLRDLSLALARTTKYGAHQIPSLSEVFGVSPLAMAIRIEELKLVTKPRLDKWIA